MLLVRGSAYSQIRLLAATSNMRNTKCLPRLEALKRQFSSSPLAISCYSQVDGVIEYNSATALRRFIGPPDDIDLSEEMPNDIDLSSTPHRLDAVIEACMLSHGKSTLLQADVITRRGVLTSLSCTERKEAEFNLSFVDGKLFVEQHYSDDVGPMSPAGFSFEQKCTASNGGSFLKGAYYSVVARRIGSLNLVYAGEVDCVTDIPSDGIPQPSSFLELKTRLDTKNRWWIHRDNRKWFMQAYLLGTPNLFIGYRDKNNNLQGTEMIAVKDLRTVFKDKDPPFDPLYGLEKIHAILQFIMRHLTTFPMPKYLRDRAVWRMKLTPDGIQDIYPLTQREVQTLNSGGGERRIGVISERVFNLMQRG